MPYHVYVTVSGEDRIARFAMDEASGALAPRDDVPLGGRPAYTAVHPSRRWMYVARKDARQVTTFRIDAADGALAEVGHLPIGSDPAYLATDRAGRFLFSASYFDGVVGVHRIGEDGAVTGDPIEWRHTGMRAHSMEADPGNRFVFVPHICSEDGPNAIFQFRFDAATGRLTPNEPDRCAPPGPDGPRHGVFHPALPLLYVSHEQGSSSGVYALDPARGTLTHRQTVSTLPAGWTGENKTSQIRLTPDARFLYVPNRGHDSIAGFAVQPGSGLLTALGQTEAEHIPRALQVDPAGRFLLSAGHASGRLATYRIHGESGRLERIATRDLGAVPMWITILPGEE